MSQTTILPSSEQAGESGQTAPHAQENVSMVVSPVTGESSPASKIPEASDITEQLLTHYPDADADMVRRAYEYASAAHAGQLRLSGDPYILHPASVALTLAKMGFDEHAVAAGLLHDTVEDTDSSIDELDELFGEQVADIVDGVTKINMMTFDTKEEAQAENIRKMILSMAHDIRVPVVKLADRLHNMSTLDFQKPYKQQRIAKETMDIYAPLANRLGLHLFKQKLEDLSFRYLQPDAYTEITSWLKDNQIVERQLISKVIAKIEGIMTDNRINGRVFGRIKQTYSIYRKMMAQKTPLDEMHDIIAFRVIVNDLRDCYAMLGLVHVLWKPVPGRFKDYISMPKANGYQSLHTTVIGPEGERIEIQIRTEEMNNMAEHGVAAHWMYKERNHAIAMQDMPQFQWLRDLMERQRDEADSREFMSSLRMDLFNDEIYVFTPTGELIKLAKGATVLDFAFAIHTNLGCRCVSAKVNEKNVPIKYVLNNGDTVSIVTSPTQSPKRDWLNIVVTSKARVKIKQALREETAKAVDFAKEMLQRRFKNRKIEMDEPMLMRYIKKKGFKTVTDFYIEIAEERLDPNHVIDEYVEFARRETETNEHMETRSAETFVTTTEAEEIATNKDVLVIDQNLTGIEYKLAKCCNPIYGDPVFGFVTIHSGITIHRTDCPNAKRLREEYPYRVLTAKWRQTSSSGAFRATIRVQGDDVPGLAGRITDLISQELKLNIRSMSFGAQRGVMEGQLSIEVNSAQVVDMVLYKLKKIKEVTRAFRVN